MDGHSYSDQDVSIYVRAAQKALLESLKDDQELGSALRGIYRGIARIAVTEFPEAGQSSERTRREAELIDRILGPILESSPKVGITAEDVIRLKRRILEMELNQ